MGNEEAKINKEKTKAANEEVQVDKHDKAKRERERERLCRD